MSIYEATQYNSLHIMFYYIKTKVGNINRNNGQKHLIDVHTENFNVIYA